MTEKEEQEEQKKTKGKRPLSKKKKTMRILSDIVIGILLCVMVFSGYKVGKALSNYHHNRVMQDKVADIYYGSAQSSTAADGEEASAAPEQESQEASVPEGKEKQEASESSKSSGPSAQLKALMDANPDTFGWIRMDGTPIDYVVVQGEDNNQYLHADFFNQYNFAGTVFLDAGVDQTASLQNYIIYGHRMQDGSMFGTLGKMLDQDYFRQHPEFHLSLKDGEYTAKIFAVVQTTTDYDWWITGFGSQEARDQYVQHAIDSSYFDCGVTVGKEDQIVTLSTCDYVLDDWKGRLLVMAKLVKD